MVTIQPFRSDILISVVLQRFLSWCIEMKSLPRFGLKEELDLLLSTLYSKACRISLTWGSPKMAIPKVSFLFCPSLKCLARLSWMFCMFNSNKILCTYARKYTKLKIQGDSYDTILTMLHQVVTLGPHWQSCIHNRAGKSRRQILIRSWFNLANLAC